MFRSMTSDVSALSNIVANGHQTVHLVSSTPSKIPYCIIPSDAQRLFLSYLARNTRVAATIA
jgi:hypothetical protein